MIVESKPIITVLGRKVSLDDDMQPHLRPCQVEVTAELQEHQTTKVRTWVWKARRMDQLGWHTSGDPKEAIVSACGAHSSDDGEEWLDAAVEGAESQINVLGTEPAPYRGGPKR
jgi:hypothetical protein